MPSPEANKFVMKAVTDFEFRNKFLANPAKAAEEEGADASVVKEFKKLNAERLRRQFDHLSRVSTDLLSPVASGHSKDWSDGNIHDKDAHIHDKDNASLMDIHAPFTNPGPDMFRGIDPTALKEALSDPVVLREFENNPELRDIIKNIK